ncbi:MAG: response regulator transcription factor [Chitinispirillales bacterium]|jgi:two-component system alkaline phosphatase synthesis response regulator PhoP|nr:response regulator transcription factor [Chitinispirillales bacterium]
MIFIVEDDVSIRELVIYSLKNSGFECKGFSDGGQFWTEIEKNVPELVLLDIMLPKEDGLSILKKIRSMKTISDIPVIMLTAKSSEFDKVIGLDSGADDYVSKPFGITELLARIKRLLARTKKSCVSDNKMILGILEVDTAKHLVSSDGKKIDLTLKEFDLLVFLMRSKNIVYSREELLEKVWGYDVTVETRTVDTHIMSLRAKIDKARKYIQTIRGVGYKIGEIE